MQAKPQTRSRAARITGSDLELNQRIENRFEKFCGDDGPTIFDMDNNFIWLSHDGQGHAVGFVTVLGRVAQ